MRLPLPRTTHTRLMYPVTVKLDGKRLSSATEQARTARLDRFQQRRQQHPHRYRLSLWIHSLANRVWHP